MRGLQQLGDVAAEGVVQREGFSLLTSSCSLHVPRSIEAAMARLMAMVLRTRADRPARYYETGEIWRAEASRHGLRPAQGVAVSSSPQHDCGLARWRACAATPAVVALGSGPRARVPHAGRAEPRVSPALRKSTAPARAVRTVASARSRSARNERTGEVVPSFYPAVKSATALKTRLRTKHLSTFKHLPLHR